MLNEAEEIFTQLYQEGEYVYSGRSCQILCLDFVNLSVDAFIWLK